jgi:hypothetical protein
MRREEGRNTPEELHSSCEAFGKWLSPKRVKLLPSIGAAHSPPDLPTLTRALGFTRQDAARLGFADEAIRIVLQEETILDRLLRGALDDADVAFEGAVALLD